MQNRIQKGHTPNLHYYLTKTLITTNSVSVFFLFLFLFNCLFFSCFFSLFLLFTSPSSIAIIFPSSFFFFLHFQQRYLPQELFLLPNKHATCIVNVRWVMSTTCLGIVAEIRFQCFANLSKLIDFCSAWNHQKPCLLNCSVLFAWEREFRW